MLPDFETQFRAKVIILTFTEHSNMSKIRLAYNVVICTFLVYHPALCYAASVNL